MTSSPSVSDWDRRYGLGEFVYGKVPNDFLVWPTGKAEMPFIWRRLGMR